MSALASMSDERISDIITAGMEELSRRNLMRAKKANSENRSGKET